MIFQGKRSLSRAPAFLCGEMARVLFECGANVAILDYNLQSAQQTADSFERTPGSDRTLAVQANVLQPEAVQKAMDAVLAEFGQIDGLINGAGGNNPEATTSAEKSFFDLPQDALRCVFELYLMGTIFPSQIIGRHMADHKQGPS